MRRDRPSPSVLRISLAVAVVVIALLSVTTASAALRARSSMERAEDHLQQARAAVQELDVERADAALAEAGTELAAARRRLERLDVRLAAHLPVVGDDLRTASAIAEGAARVATAGRTVTAAVLSLPGGTDSLLPRGGALPAAALAELVAPVEAAAAAVAGARDLVASSPGDGLVRQVADARADFLGLVGPVVGSLDTLATLARALPPFLGHDAPRRYFLAAANPAEQRGTVGFLGSYAIATFDEGRLRIGSFGDLNELEDVPVAALDDPALPPRYDPFGGSGTWKNLNMTPDFPTAATAIELLWAEVHGDPVDGTIVVDPFALAALVELSGPVELADGTMLPSDDVVDYVTNEAYADFDDGDERKGVLGEVAGAALLGFLGSADGDVALASLETLGRLIADRHLLIHSSDPVVQDGFAAVGADGALPDPPGDLVAVVANAAHSAKLDYYMDRSLDYRVELLADGRARGELEVTFTNDAPATGRPRHVLGPNVRGLEVGDNRFHLSTFCATSCAIQAADGALTVSTLEEELGHPVASTWVEVPRGRSATVGYRWEVADAWEDTDGALVYRLTIRHQVTVRPTEVRVRIAVPDSLRAVDLADGLEQQGDAIVHRSTARGGTTELEVRLRPR